MGYRMNTDETIEAKIIASFQPSRLKIDNDSHQHAGRKIDTHFRLVIVAESFENQSLVNRQRSVYSCLEAELAGPVHALQMKCLTSTEYQALKGDVTLEAPRCKGGH
jgi:BolA protein